METENIFFPSQKALNKMTRERMRECNFVKCEKNNDLHQKKYYISAKAFDVKNFIDFWRIECAVFARNYLQNFWFCIPIFNLYLHNWHTVLC